MSDLNMPSSTKEKNYANTRARRHSHEIVISQSKKKKKKKDTDTESLTSSSTSSDATVVPADSKGCPFRFMLVGLMETKDEEVQSGCPLRRVQLWHTIPLCLLAIINLLLVIIALLGLAGYRIAISLQAFVRSLPNLQHPIVNSQALESDDVATIAEKM